MIDFSAFQIKIDSAFSLSWKKNTAYARARKYDALSFRVRGSANYEHADQKYRVEKNDILFVPANYDYVITANKDEEVLVVHFFIENSSFSKMEIFKPLNPDVFYRLFTEMSEVWRTKSVGYQSRLLSLFYKICEQIAVQENKRSLLLKPVKLQEALTYLHENFTSPETTVESVAKYVGASTVYLRKLFHESVKQSPLQYLNGLRIDYAIDLLKTGYYTIDEISNLSGFNDPKYFSVLYKKRTGELPSKRLKHARRSLPRIELRSNRPL